MSETQIILEKTAAELVARARDGWRGREREAIIEIVRAADEAAFYVRFFPEHPDTDRRRMILKGVATALATFLPAMKGGNSGIPFIPSTPETAGWIDSLLLELGKLAVLQRFAALESYGLARCQARNPLLIEMTVQLDHAEVMDRQAGRWLNAEIERRVAASHGPQPNLKLITKLLDRTSAVDPQYMIRYDGHKKLLKFYRERAQVEVSGSSESEALSDDAQIGGRTFAEWRDMCTLSLGAVLNHVAYASRLRSKHPHLMLRNVLTMPVRREDITAVWLERNSKPGWVEATLSHLTIDAQTIGPWQMHHELPTPFYVDVGEGWLLLSLFGGLLNPVCGLVRQLRLRYTKEWDVAVGDRERRFREDLAARFPAPRYLVPNNGFKLRRSDGSHLTDIDAVVLDRRSGTLALVQLKWPDIFGLSPRERESRRLNLLKANDWVQRVTHWVDGRTGRDVARALGLSEDASTQPPLLLVVPRYAARFTGNDAFDARAAWVAWAEVARHAAKRGKARDPLTELAERFRAGGLVDRDSSADDVTYKIGTLEAHVRFGSA